MTHWDFSEQYPENSPLAFRATVEQTTCDGFESDCHIPRDGQLIVFHDAELERTSNGRGFIKDHSYKELLQLDIAAWKAPQFAEQHIWTLGQLLDFCRKPDSYSQAEKLSDFL